MPVYNHKFVIMVNKELITYTRYEDIPNVIDHVITFLPDFANGPHTDEQHEEIVNWNNKLQELMRRERNNASNM